MEHKLSITNSLTGKKELFIPLHEPNVGLYVCGPTVYGDAHLGHARPAITFDILFRYLQFLGYKVRYVRNVTDVGHLENDSDDGEDKIEQRARLENIEPMEIVQRYLNNYHENMRQLNVKPPSIEPHASGHILEQQQMIRKILDKGYAYQANGSVYFDVEKYSNKNHYGILSGRNLDDMRANTRKLSGQDEKQNPFDFALWKKATPEHIMHWSSEWSEGFPGWHLECSAMGTKYLGDTFDIHGGGMDLLFPHHECEIAQSMAANGTNPVKYWMHNNMITINGQKMGKSLNNFITLDEFFTNEHKILEQAYHPMVVRFFILQAHYRSTLDFSNVALQASEEGLKRLTKSWKSLNEIIPHKSSSEPFFTWYEKCLEALNDDLNTPIAIAQLFEAVRIINLLKENNSFFISETDLKKFKELYSYVISEILGIDLNWQGGNTDNVEKDLIDVIVNLRLQARKNKDFATSDVIRNKLAELGINLNDTKDGTSWERI
jgi:cysteinyl-tRNA synthetase